MQFLMSFIKFGNIIELVPLRDEYQKPLETLTSPTRNLGH